MSRTVLVKTARLERERLKLGLTRTEFAVRCGISGASRTKLFRGEAVDLAVVRKIGAALGIETGRLIVIPRADEPAPENELAPVVAAAS